MAEFSFFDFAQKHYFAEFERRKEINTSVSLAIGLATLSTGALVRMGSDIRQPLQHYDLILLLLLLMALAAITTASIYLVKSYVGHSYRYIASMSLFKTWRNDVIAAGFSEAELDVESRSVIISQYIDAVATNDVINERKSGFLHRANVALVTALAFLAMAALPWRFAYLDALQHKQYIALKETTMTEPQRKPQEQERVMPAPPPTRLIKESEIPKERELRK